MSNPMDREGNFQIAIKEYGLTERDSGAVAISVIAAVTAEWNADAGQWDDWTNYDVEVRGDLYVVKKDKTLNQGTVEALCKHAGWNASLQAIVDQTWKPTPCQCTVEANTYKDVTTWKIGFINQFDRTPGGVGNMSAEKAKAFDAQYGGQLRAVAGSTTHGTTKPQGRPAPPNRRNVGNDPYPDPNALDAANAELGAEGAKNRGTGEPADEPEFAK